MVASLLLCFHCCHFFSCCRRDELWREHVLTKGRREKRNAEWQSVWQISFAEELAKWREVHERVKLSSIPLWRKGTKPNPYRFFFFFCSFGTTVELMTIFIFENCSCDGMLEGKHSCHSVSSLSRCPSCTSAYLSDMSHSFLVRTCSFQARRHVWAGFIVVQLLNVKLPFSRPSRPISF